MNRPLFDGFVFQDEILLPSGELIIGEPIHNKTPQQGVDFLAGLLMGNETPISSWYVFIFEGNYVPTGDETAADIPSTIGECTAYVAAARPLFSHSYDGVSTIDNLADKAKFVMTADKTINGAGIVSSSVKAGGGGVLISLVRYDSPRVLAAGTEYTVGGAIPLISTDF